jgi:hypothetical protein
VVSCSLLAVVTVRKQESLAGPRPRQAAKPYSLPDRPD